MESRKRIIALHNTVLPFIHSVVLGMFDSRNAETASKPNASCVTTVPK